MKKVASRSKTHSKESALAFHIDNNLSKETNSTLAKDSKEHGFPIYPSYWSIYSEKRNCKPTA